MRTIEERHEIYKKLLFKFYKIQNSHGNEHLSAEVTSYFLAQHLDLNDFPEIIKQKPKEVIDNPLIYQGYWFKEMNSAEAIPMHRNILLRAIRETAPKVLMTIKEARKFVATYLRSWCDNGGDSEGTIDGYIQSGIIDPSDKEIIEKAFKFYADKLRKDELKYS
ncbi:MAG: hypothetical protein PHT07_15580 [Paludibacter sp.]|nr:hypothetical protein [Paludibacter sp.]